MIHQNDSFIAFYGIHFSSQMSSNHRSLKCVSPCIQVVLVDLEALVVPAVKSSEPVDSHKNKADHDCTPDTRVLMNESINAGAVVLTRLSSRIESPFSPFCPSTPYNTY